MRAILVASALAATQARGFAMPWMCLERCGDNAANITQQLHQFAVNSTLLNVASFELFNLGPNSTLVTNNLTQVASTLRKDGIKTIAMLSSYPYPPQFLSYMRQVFTNPQPFIDACISAARQYGLNGYNVDWEPVSGNGAPTPTAQDAADYAAFLTTFSDALHKAGLIATVDVATWSPIWNFTAIAASSVDYVMTMSTYTSDFPTFQTQLSYALSTIPAGKLVVGLETVKDNNGTPYPDAELKERFDLLAAANVTRLGLWRAPVPDNWWQFLDALI